MLMPMKEHYIQFKICSLRSFEGWLLKITDNAIPSSHCDNLAAYFFASLLRNLLKLFLYKHLVYTLEEIE